ncbi:hypothetical protein [Bacteroides sp.]|uniref:hypothetical protein n=1 Tax=Bacteroides sp. TaxID=29523 RepID=UPI0026361051|nr:hypothetical protein [Bacteroides sp.]MDD3038999.1 hypothetical protein [Bacteroides sp.]
MTNPNAIQNTQEMITSSLKKYFSSALHVEEGSSFSHTIDWIAREHAILTLTLEDIFFSKYLDFAEHVSLDNIGLLVSCKRRGYEPDSLYRQRIRLTIKAKTSDSTKRSILELLDTATEIHPEEKAFDLIEQPYLGPEHPNAAFAVSIDKSIPATLNLSALTEYINIAKAAGVAFEGWYFQYYTDPIQVSTHLNISPISLQTIETLNISGISIPYLQIKTILPPPLQYIPSYYNQEEYDNILFPALIPKPDALALWVTSDDTKIYGAFPDTDLFAKGYSYAYHHSHIPLGIPDPSSPFNVGGYDTDTYPGYLYLKEVSFSGTSIPYMMIWGFSPKLSDDISGFGMSGYSENVYSTFAQKHSSINLGIEPTQIDYAPVSTTTIQPTTPALTSYAYHHSHIPGHISIEATPYNFEGYNLDEYPGYLNLIEPRFTATHDSLILTYAYSPKTEDEISGFGMSGYSENVYSTLAQKYASINLNSEDAVYIPYIKSNQNTFVSVIELPETYIIHPSTQTIIDSVETSFAHTQSKTTNYSDHASPFNSIGFSEPNYSTKAILHAPINITVSSEIITYS